MKDNRALFWNSDNNRMFYKVYDLSHVPRIGEKISIKCRMYLVKDIYYHYIGIDVESDMKGQVDINILVEEWQGKPW